MKILPSVIFPSCSFSGDKDVGFYDTVPNGFDQPVSLYLIRGIVKDDDAIFKASAFFDLVLKWDDFCRNIFVSVSEGSEDHKMVMEYFEFYRD